MEESVLPPVDNQNNQSSQPKKHTRQEKRDAANINHPKEFEIEEVKTEIYDDVEKGGFIESWELRQFIEHRRMRALLTYCTVSLWLLWTLSGMVHFLLTGNVFLIATSPPLALFLRIIFKYYFHRR